MNDLVAENQALRDELEAVKAKMNKIKADAVRNVPFPVVIRKMWSGGEVREMLDNHANQVEKGQ